MPLYLSQHTLACLTRQGAEALMRRMQAGQVAKAERVLVNMLEGKMFAEFRADSRESLEAWLKTEGMHFDWLVRIEWESRGGQVVQGCRGKRPATENQDSQKNEMLHSPLCVTLFDSKSRKEPN